MSTDDLYNCVLALETRTDPALEGPLEGWLIGVKDNVDVAGLATTNGLGAAAARVAERDAVVVAQLRAAGARILGKLNMDEAALGASGANPHHGAVHNPLRPGFSAGGSSSGSAAAVAAGLCDAAIGSDTLGSVRIPAAYCAVAALKPSAGAVSREGLAALCPSLDQVGPLARCAADLAPLLDAIAAPGALARDAPPWAPLFDLGGLRIGVPSSLAELDIEDAVRRAFDAALDLLRGLDARVEHIDVARFGDPAARRDGLLVVEVEGAAQHARSRAAHPEAYSPTLSAMLDYGRDALPARVAAARRRIAADREAMRAAFEAVHLVAAPTAPQRPFALDTDAPVSQADLTAPASFAGCPALSVPCAVGSDGLPVGLQLVAGIGRDRALLAAGACFEKARGLA